MLQKYNIFFIYKKYFFVIYVNLVKLFELTD